MSPGRAGALRAGDGGDAAGASGSGGRGPAAAAGEMGRSGGRESGGGIAEASWTFTLPPELEAHEPPEARGLRRDEVRLLVTAAGHPAVHTRFTDLPRFLAPGDVVVVNVSGTIPAAVAAGREDGSAVRVHLSSRTGPGRWRVELRRPRGAATEPLFDGREGERLELPAGASVRLREPFGTGEGGVPAKRRLWEASVSLPGGWRAYLERHGAPIRYRYVPRPWPVRFYRTVYAAEPGSAEMPSAGRAFSARVLVELLARGVLVVPVVLHTGVSSLESDEAPYPEPYRVPPATADAVNAARRRGSRVIAVGTTVVRALESVTGPGGVVRPGEGWTDLVVTPERGVRAVDGLMTGFHEPRSTHLAMLEALAGADAVRAGYEEALRGGYLWHEFGDLQLML